jgi:hypothetical protein
VGLAWPATTNPKPAGEGGAGAARDG